MTDAYIYLSLNQLAVREVQKNNHSRRRCIRLEDEQRYFRRNGCFYKRKIKVDNHSNKKNDA